MRYLLLLLLSSPAFAVISQPPSFEVLLQQMFQISPDTARFSGWFTLREHGGVIGDLTMTSSVDFGDGQSISSSGTTVGADHTYAPGSFTAVMTLSAIGQWREINNFTSPIIPINWNFTKSLAVNVVSHMPEPTTYAMLLGGLILLPWLARKSKPVVLSA